MAEERARPDARASDARQDAADDKGVRVGGDRADDGSDLEDGDERDEHRLGGIVFVYQSKGQLEDAERE
ncbi:hypothetical protein SLS64_006165 [Diaporthe eres]